MSGPSPIDILTALSDAARVGDADHVRQILEEFPTICGIPTVAIGSSRPIRVQSTISDRLTLSALFPSRADDAVSLTKSLAGSRATARSPLHAAAANGHASVVAILRRTVASLTPGLTSHATDPVPLPPSLSLSVWLRLLASPNDGGNTPLHWAALNNHGAIIHHALTALGTVAASDDDATDATDASPSEDVASLLAAVLNSRDGRGWTCADTAYHARHQELYEALLALGVTPGGGTAIDSGAEEGVVREEVGTVDQADLDGLD